MSTWGSMSRHASRSGARSWCNAYSAAMRSPACTPVTLWDYTARPLLAAGVAEVHQFPDRVVLVGLGQLATAIPGDLEVTGESQVGTVEVGQLGGDALEALEGVGHPGCGQVVGAGKRHHVPVLSVLIGVARCRRDGLAGRLIGVDPFPCEGDLGPVVADEDVVAGEHEDRNGLEPI